MTFKLASPSSLDNFLAAVTPSLNSRKLYIVTDNEYNNVPRTVLEVFSPYLALLLSSTNCPEETPTIFLQDVKSETIKNLVDLIQSGAIYISTKDQEMRKQIIEDIHNLAKVLNINMETLSYEGDIVSETAVKQKMVKNDISDELLLYEENLFCQEMLKQKYSETTTEYFESISIECPIVKTEEVSVENMKKEVFVEEKKEEIAIVDKKSEVENKNKSEATKVDRNERVLIERSRERGSVDDKIEGLSIRDQKEDVRIEDMKEDGEISEDDEVFFTFQCFRCKTQCQSSGELRRHTDSFHRTDKQYRYSRMHSTLPINKNYSSKYPYFHSNSESSQFSHFKNQHRYRSKELGKRIKK